MMPTPHPDEGSQLTYDTVAEGFISNRTSLDDFSPSDVTSIFSQDYMTDGSGATEDTPSMRWAGPLRHVDWIGVALTLNEWNLRFVKTFSPSFFHNLFSEHQERQAELPTHVDPVYLTTKQPVQRSESVSIKCLDGLRGVACFFVFNFHFLYPFTNTIIHGYGAPFDDGVRVFAHTHQLPFLSLIYRGRAMVAVFFAISGYVLSRKVLLNFRSGNADNARRNLTSSVFRRALRLYLPPTVSMFLVMIMVYLGMFLSEKQIYAGQNSKYITGSWEEHPPRARWPTNQLMHWFNMWMAWSNPFTWEPFYSLYDPHTWTIPLEFRSSIALFATLLGTANLKSKWRVATTTLLTLYCLRLARWDVALFLGGMLICEVDLITGIWETPSDIDRDEKMQEMQYSASSTNLSRRYFVQALKWTVFGISLYLLSFPDENSKQTPGFIALTELTPKAYAWKYSFWHTLGAVCAVWAVNNLEVLRSFFEFGLFQYLGKISFAFYLVHGPILHSIGFMLMPEIWKLTGFNGDQGFVAGLAIGWLILLTLSIWCADLFWRFVDIPSTNLARKIERGLSS